MASYLLDWSGAGIVGHDVLVRCISLTRGDVRGAMGSKQQDINTTGLKDCNDTAQYSFLNESFFVSRGCNVV